LESALLAKLAVGAEPVALPTSEEIFKIYCADKSAGEWHRHQSNYHAGYVSGWLHSAKANSPGAAAQALRVKELEAGWKPSKEAVMLAAKLAGEDGSYYAPDGTFTDDGDHVLTLEYLLKIAEANRQASHMAS